MKLMSTEKTATVTLTRRDAAILYQLSIEAVWEDAVTHISEDFDVPDVKGVTIAEISDLHDRICEILDTLR